MASKRVLIIATSHAEMGATGHKTGLWLEELSTPYYALLDGGAEITLASIKGGQIPFDPRSIPAQAGEGAGEEPAERQDVPESVRRFLADEQATRLARLTASVTQLAGIDFDAVLLPGGHGTMWDFAGNRHLADLVGQAFGAGKIVAAVCHGPAGLVDAKGPNGRFMVEGRRVTAFTNSEEEAVGLTKVVPFLLETRLRDNGARFECGPDWQPFAVRDGNLITGQNPQSSERVADLVLEALEERAEP